MKTVLIGVIAVGLAASFVGCGGSGHGGPIGPGLLVSGVSPKTLSAGSVSVATPQTVSLTGMFNEPGNGQTIVTWTATLTLVGSNPPTTVTSGYAVQTPTTTLTTLTFTAPPAAGTYDIQVSAVEGSSTLATSATSTADRLTVD